MTLTTAVDKGAYTVARRVTVAATPDELFAQIANPYLHSQIDGSATVTGKVTGPERLSEGATFSQSMKMFGVPYRITSTVTEFVDDGPSRRIEWQHPLGHRWLWEFEPVAGKTQVTESFRYGTAKARKLLELFAMPARNASGIEQTLDKLAERYGS